MKKLLGLTPLAILTICVSCSEAPLIDFPEPTNRIVLAEFFSKEF